MIALRERRPTSRSARRRFGRSRRPPPDGRHPIPWSFPQKSTAATAQKPRDSATGRKKASRSTSDGSGARRAGLTHSGTQFAPAGIAQAWNSSIAIHRLRKQPQHGYCACSARTCGTGHLVIIDPYTPWLPCGGADARRTRGACGWPPERTAADRDARSPASHRGAAPYPSAT